MGVYSSIRCETSNDWCGNEFVLCLNGLWANSIESNEILHSIQKVTELIEIPNVEVITGVMLITESLHSIWIAVVIIYVFFV